MNKTIHRAELIDELARSLGGDKQGAEVAINALFGDLSSGGGDGIIPLILKRGDRVVITGFGVFVVKKVAAREGRNPKTGESIQIPAHRRVAFWAGKGLKSRVAG